MGVTSEMILTKTNLPKVEITKGFLIGLYKVIQQLHLPVGKTLGEVSSCVLDTPICDIPVNPMVSKIH